MRKKFKIFYCKHNPDPDKAGKKYKPRENQMVVMSSSGLFFLVYNESYYPSIRNLHDVIGNYDVVWNDERDSD